MKNRLTLMLFIAISACGEEPISLNSATREHQGLMQRSGNEVGNGGDVVVCENDGQKTYELLDIYEGRTLRGLIPDFEINDHDPFVLAKNAFGRLSHLDPERSNLFLSGLEFFKSHHRFLTEIEVPKVSDEGSYNLAKNCELQQVAAQKQEETPDDNFFIIAKPLWDKLTPTHKAALVMHEVIYHEGIRRGHPSSRHSRYFNSVLMSQDIRSMESDRYEKVLLGSRMDEYMGFASSGVYYRYFPRKLLTFDETEKFCSSLPRSRMTGTFNSTAWSMHKVIWEQINSGIATTNDFWGYWVLEPKYNVFSVPLGGAENTIESWRSPTEKLGVICVTDLY